MTGFHSFRAAIAPALIALLCMSGCAAPATREAPGEAVFRNFVYAGQDPNPAAVATEGNYLNPILSGFYPDPSITQVGQDFYLVHSTFTWFPGIPVWHSTDLVNWTQIGNAIDRPGMLDFDGLGLSRGVFAPTIEHHDGTFYIANTCVDCEGNFILTAKDPAGPWSDPIWMPHVGGIDPSLFFDTDGKVWLMNNDGPPGEVLYDGHRAIWIREVHPETFAPLSEPVVIIDGGVRPEEKPIWIEGPHIYLKDGWYYLSAAEGGTAVGHSQVILRSRTVTGPYTPYEGNPIMTQRDLPEDRLHPVTSVGHADYVIDNEGAWWAVFLGVRPYEGDYYNTGRETFLLPVTWKDGWPVILERGAPVPISLSRPALPASHAPPLPTTGNFSVSEDFSGPLPPHWMTPRVPKSEWYSIGEGTLALQPRTDTLGSSRQPSFLARRQQHMNASAEVEIVFTPTAKSEAGLAAFQSDEYWFALGLALSAETGTILRLRQRSGPDKAEAGIVLAEIQVPDGKPLRLRFEGEGASYQASWSVPGEDWQDIGPALDGKLLSTRTAGGFVGAVFGVYAETSE
ncbi:MAG TPA: glycoside hydrolase family 43 protein [Hyphomonas sp.]|nr:glycoside hydrolase 43 family protein [Hyphomonas sp.]HRK66840.1 glycoside hydrolase family 43 protein [Hyphomonas sp.]